MVSTGGFGIAAKAGVATITDADGVCEVESDEGEKRLREILQNPRLVVLAGSGTSRGLRGRVRSAPMMSDLLSLVKALPSYDRFVREHPQLANESDVEVLLSKAQAVAALGASRCAEEFLTEASSQIREACDFLDETSDLGHHTVFLRKAVARTAGRERLTLFTTNYDLVFEAAARGVRISTVDGFGYGGKMRFSGANFQQDLVMRGERGELQLVNEVIRLFKLHGSIDWDEQGDGVYRSGDPDRPVLIYPSTSKYQQSYRQPFLEAMSHYQTSLRTPETTMVVVGYGFNDSHLNQPIIDALMGDATFKLLVVSPDVLTSSQTVTEMLRRSIDAGDKRVGLLNGTFADLAAAFPDLPTRDPWQATRDAIQAIWGTR